MAGLKQLNLRTLGEVTTARGDAAEFLMAFNSSFDAGGGVGFAIGDVFVRGLARRVPASILSARIASSCLALVCSACLSCG